jgi:hypothetical protein
MRCLKVIALLAAAMLARTAIGAALAATVIAEGEGVFLDSGYGFRPVVSGEEAGAGVRIRTAAGTATIFYGNGCSQTVDANSLAIVLEHAPDCNAGGGSLKDPGADSSLFSTATLITGGLALAGGTALIVTETLHPASP